MSIIFERVFVSLKPLLVMKAESCQLEANFFGYFFSSPPLFDADLISSYLFLKRDR